MYNDTKNSFAGIRIQQTYIGLCDVERILKYFDFSQAVEIGTGYGGLSLFISLHRVKVITFEIEFNKSETDFSYDIEFHQGIDVFKEVTRIKYIIGAVLGKTLLILDGGNKVREFNTFVPMLKKGDVVMVHDFGNEITRSDINASLMSKLQMIYTEDSLWFACLIK